MARPSPVPPDPLFVLLLCTHFWPGIQDDLQLPPFLGLDLQAGGEVGGLGAQELGMEIESFP